MVTISARQIRERTNKILRDLNGLSLETIKLLLVISDLQNPNFGTTDLRERTNLKERVLGGRMRALTSVKIGGENLIIKLPFKTNRNNSYYIWNEKAAKKIDVKLALKEILKSYP